MNPPITSVVRIASTAAQAKIFVALLQAEGIPAHTDGDSLADEVAVSRRLIHLNGTRVMVPTASLERSREILQAVQIDDADLAAQALAAENPEPPAPSIPDGPRTSRWPLLAAGGAAITFLGLWLSEVEARAGSRNPVLRYEPTRFGMRELRIRDGKLLREYEDADHNGTYEQILSIGKTSTTTSYDLDDDGLFEKVEERHADGTVVTWTDADADGIVELGVVCDGNGKELQRLSWSPAQHYQLLTR